MPNKNTTIYFLISGITWSVGVVLGAGVSIYNIYHQHVFQSLEQLKSGYSLSTSLMTISIVLIVAGLASALYFGITAIKDKTITKDTPGKAPKILSAVYYASISLASFALIFLLYKRN